MPVLVSGETTGKQPGQQRPNSAKRRRQFVHALHPAFRNHATRKAIARADMGTARKVPRRHSGRLRRADSHFAVLDHQAILRPDAEPRCREEEQIGRGFAVGHLRGREGHAGKEGRKPGDIERDRQALGAAAGRKAEGSLHALKQRPDARHRLQIRRHAAQQAAAVVRLEICRKRPAEALFGPQRGCGEAAAEEVAAEDLGRDRQFDLGHHVHQDARTQHLAVDEDAVAIEDHRPDEASHGCRV